MRIFYASGATPNGALPGSRIWYANLHDALVDMGHDVVEFDYDLEPLIAAADTSRLDNSRFVEQHRRRASEELVAQVRKAHARASVDLFFSYFSSSCAEPEAIHEIKALGIPTVNWYCNASYQLHLVEEIAPAFDACLVPERYRLDDYKRLGARPMYCQEAANPGFYRPLPLDRDLDVVFVGARYGDRPEYVWQLLEAGIDVRVFGPGWLPPTPWQRLRRLRPRSAAAAVKRRIGGHRLATPATVAPIPPSVCGGILRDEELPVVYSRAKIVLGFSSVGNTHATGERVTQIRLRDFEAPMCGAFYMVEDMPELAEFFDVGREIATYRDADDLVAKCRYFLEHEEERERVRAAGHARALRDHTWQRRFSDIFEQLSLPA